MKETMENLSSDADADHVKPLPIVPAAIASSSIPLVAVPVMHDEEYATELAEPMNQLSRMDGLAEPVSRAWGWSALVVSIVSLFIMPVIFGCAGVILGIVAFFQGNRSLGGWSIAISLVSIFTSLVLVPNYA